MVLDSFHVESETAPDAGALAHALRTELAGPIEATPLVDAEVRFDGSASPWHTVCEVVVDDAPGVLHAIAAAFAGAGIEVRAAQVSSHGGLVIDRFEVTDATGGKISEESERRFRDLLRSGVSARRRRFGRRLLVRTMLPLA